MAIPVEIVNPEIVNYFECENERREQSWLSAMAITLLGIAQIIKYGDLYGKAVDWRKEINDKILACAKAEHCFWITETYPFMKGSFDYVCQLFEIDPQYLAQLDAKYAKPLPTLTQWVGKEVCGPCTDSCNQVLSIAAAKGRIGAHTSRVRTLERVGERRREVKAQGMSVIDRAAQSTAIPGRQAMSISLGISNALVAIASAGLNSGLSTFGRGLAGFANMGES